MKTSIHDDILQIQAGQKAEEILRKCVHCGFCNATCPTYQELNDERDGPRGRIYLIKSMLEGNEVSEKTQRHLDQCLTCRSCETTCPSGVEYSKLLDIGREHLEKRIPRPIKEKVHSISADSAFTSSHIGDCRLSHFAKNQTAPSHVLSSQTSGEKAHQSGF
nr:4Fe-4S dicluster domain-containing protein [Enterovibrio nigricans]